MKCIYVAARYRAPTVNGIHDHIEQARRCAVDLWKAGACALTPHLNSAYMDGVADDTVFLEGGLELLRRCDALVVVMDDKEYSSGVCGEMALAEREGMPVFYWAECGDGEEIVRSLEHRTDLRTITRQ